MNIDFFNLLLEKLNVDSMRSIYLNAVPARRRARIDILELDKIEEKFSEKLFENLFSKDSFEIKIKLTNEEKNEKIEKQIQYLYNEEINIFREEGISSFSIGYPIFVKQSSKTQIADYFCFFGCTIDYRVFKYYDFWIGFIYTNDFVFYIFSV